MKHSMMRKLATGLVLVMGLAGASVASAQTGWNRGWGSNLTGVWQLQSRDLGGGGGYGNGPGNGGYDFRGNDNGWNRGNGNDWNSGFARGNRALPASIRIEKSGRQVRVENLNGQLLRQASVRGRRVTRMTIASSGPRGGTITEAFLLRDGGRRLEVQTTISGARGSRTFTSVYGRA